MAAAAIVAVAANQRICHPAPRLVLDNAGAAAVIIFVNNTGILSSKSHMAAIAHISAGQKEVALADPCQKEAVGQEAEAPAAGDKIVDD
jgi:hypothetical protein